MVGPSLREVLPRRMAIYPARPFVVEEEGVLAGSRS